MTIRNPDGTFVKGSIPWNKGLHVDLSKGKGQFKKGTMPPQHQQVGYIAHHKDGYTYIKIAEPSKWQLYQRYVWEKANKVKLSRNQIVIFLDGNKRNFEIDNLAVVTRKELMLLNHKKLLTSHREISKAYVLTAKLHIKIKEKEKVKQR